MSWPRCGLVWQSPAKCTSSVCISQPDMLALQCRPLAARGKAAQAKIKAKTNKSRPLAASAATMASRPEAGVAFAHLQWYKALRAGNTH